MFFYSVPNTLLHRFTNINIGRAPKNVRELEEEGLPAAALAQCPNPDRIRQILRECYSLLAVDGDANPTLVQQQASGWSAAYSLRTWADFPGSTNVCVCLYVVLMFLRFIISTTKSNLV